MSSPRDGKPPAAVAEIPTPSTSEYETLPTIRIMVCQKNLIHTIRYIEWYEYLNILKRFMPHVSKQKLKRQTFITIYNELACLVTKRGNNAKRQYFLEELLTDTEKIMLAKRLSLIIMLHRGASSYQIEKTLKISPSTTQRFALAIESGAYRNITIFLNKNSRSKMDRVVDGIFKLLVGMARPIHAPRWKWLDEI